MTAKLRCKRTEKDEKDDIPRAMYLKTKMHERPVSLYDPEYAPKLWKVYESTGEVDGKYEYWDGRITRFRIVKKRGEK